MNSFIELKQGSKIHNRISLRPMSFIALLLSPALLLSVSAQSPVPIEMEPRHRLKFENHFVRVFDVLISPGDTSLFHIHLHDGVSVRLTDASIRDEAVHGTAEDFAVKRRFATFAYRPSPLTHRVSNIGPTPFRNIFVEILPSSAGSATDQSSAAVAGYEVVLENERVRILRLLLAPGKSIDARVRARRAVRIAVSEGEVVMEIPGEKRKAVKFAPGDIEWQEKGSPPLSAEDRALFENLTIFKERRDISRAIFLSTPHRGSVLATNWIGKIGTKLIHLPTNLVKLGTDVSVAESESKAKVHLSRMPNAIDTLAPTNAFVIAMNKRPLAPGVPYHQIIGDRGRGDSPHSSDGIVEYWSSHLDGAQSTRVVPSGHMTHKNAEGIEEVRRILKQHVKHGT